MAYDSDESGRGEVYVTAFPAGGRKWQVSTGGGGHPRWRADGRELFYATPAGRYLATAVDGSGDTFVVGALSELFDGPVNTGGYDYAVAANGQRFMLNVREEAGATPPHTLVLDWAAEGR